MDKDLQLSNFQTQISSKNDLVSALQKDVNTLYDQQDVCLSNIQQLEQELIELLLNKKNLVHEFNHLKSLTTGDNSPMGRIQFVQTGVLEGTALQSIQDVIMERRHNQNETLSKINEGILQLKSNSIEIEEDIEHEKQQLLTIDLSISNNQNHIHQLNAEITVIEGKMRSIT